MRAYGCLRLFFALLLLLMAVDGLQMPCTKPHMACKKKETATQKHSMPMTHQARIILQHRLLRLAKHPTKHHSDGLLWYTAGWFFTEELQQLLFGGHL
jgi:hypothetical protein